MISTWNLRHEEHAHTEIICEKQRRTEKWNKSITSNSMASKTTCKWKKTCPSNCSGHLHCINVLYIFFQQSCHLQHEHIGHNSSRQQYFLQATKTKLHYFSFIIQQLHQSYNSIFNHTITFKENINFQNLFPLHNRTTTATTQSLPQLSHWHADSTSKEKKSIAAIDWSHFYQQETEGIIAYLSLTRTQDIITIIQSIILQCTLITESTSMHY